MILSDTSDLSNGLIQQIHWAYKGNERYPTSGNKYNRYIGIINRKIREWATDPNTSWASLWEDRTFGSVSAGTQAYDLDDDVMGLSDKVYVDRTDGSTVEFPVIKPDERNSYSNAVYMTGNSPRVLNFNNTIDTDSDLVGGDIRAAVYIMPEELANDADQVIIDSPEWLVYAVAAELSRNDPAKDDQFANLLGMANDFYDKMVTANETNPPGNPNSIPIIQDQIGAEF